MWSNEVREERLVTEIVSLDLNQSYLNDYKIIGETNHLETVQSLVETEELAGEK